MGRRQRLTLTNSFGVREVAAVRAFYACVMRGGDARQIGQSEALANVMRKFASMSAKCEAYEHTAHDGAESFVVAVVAGEA